MRKENGYWTKERCLDAARECKTQAEFRRKYNTAWGKVYRNGWLKEITWFADGNKVARKRRINESYERCRNAALSCKTMKEFYTNYTNEATLAYKHGWISEYTWLEREKKANGYWDYDKCLEAAKDCKTLREFIDRYSRAYEVARKNDWLKDYTWLVHGETPYKDNCENVYAYFFKKGTTSAVYVGLTVDPKRRDNEHRNETHNSSVYKYSQISGIKIPKMTVLESGLSANDAKIKEDYYRTKYENEGWIVLNQAATGLFSSSLGQIGRKWTYDKCYEKALLCKTQAEFDKRFRGACASAKENGWIKDYTWFVRRTYWDYDKCMEIALSCKSRGEMQKKCPEAYRRARKQKWLDDYTWFAEPKTTKKWDYDSCYKAALECLSKTEFINRYNGAYKVANRNGWIDDFFQKAA